MNVKKACEILGLDMNDPKWKDKIKLKYREKALLYHPDKNGGDPDSASKFVKVHEAYETLTKEKDVKKPSLETLVNYFVSLQDEEYWKTITGNMLVNCELVLYHIVDNMDKDNFMKIFKLIKKYKKVFHFSQLFYDKMEKRSIYWMTQGKFKERRNDDFTWSNTRLSRSQLETHKSYDRFVDDEWNLEYFVEKKGKENKDDQEYDTETIILRPSLDDIMFDNVFKYVRNDEQYIVPLWHHELVYDDLSGNEFSIQIQPKMPSSNYWIDTNNNLHQMVEYTLSELWHYVEEEKGVEIYFGKKRFIFYPKHLQLRCSQLWTWKNEGISLINHDNIYDISKRGDVIIHVNINGLL